uniref:Uncharacterized protein n=1 Tax=Quercus lobata TaxID=97700 RepID=A0A7N2LG65_QUELO
MPGLTNQEFDFVLEKVQGRLAGWNAHLLSFAGTVVLTQSVLGAIPAYVMQGAMLSGKILDAIDKTSGNFLWGLSVARRYPINVKWSKPMLRWHKLNTDESALGNPGLVGGGGIIRDHNGMYLFNLIPRWTIKHYFREANECTDKLARKGASQQ